MAEGLHIHREKRARNGRLRNIEVAGEKIGALDGGWPVKPGGMNADGNIGIKSKGNISMEAKKEVSIQASKVKVR